MEEQSNPYTAPQASVIQTDPSRALAGDSPYGPMRNTRTLGRVVRGLLWLQLAMTAIFGVLSIYIGMQSAKEVDVFFAADGLTQTPLNWIYTGVTGVMGFAFVLSVIFFCIWTNKSMKNAWALREDAALPTMAPGWAVGYYFIPILMLWKPFEGMKEIWQVTFQGERELGLLRWWWGFWLLSNFADNIGIKLPTETFEELAVSCFYDGVTTLLAIGAGILVIQIVAQVTEKQMEHFGGAH